VIVFSQRRSLGAKRLHQRVNECGEKFCKAQELLVKSEISPTECSFMSDFIKMTDDSLSEPGIRLKRRISLANAFQKSISSIPLKADLLTDNTGSQTGFSPGVDAFTTSFLKYYQSNPEFKQS
jgi:hypothetical protein